MKWKCLGLFVGAHYFQFFECSNDCSRGNVKETCQYCVPVPSLVQDWQARILLQAVPTAFGSTEPISFLAGSRLDVSIHAEPAINSRNGNVIPIGQQWGSCSFVVTFDQSGQVHFDPSMKQVHMFPVVMNQEKIARSIVPTIPVYMVNNFSTSQPTANNMLHDETVLVHHSTTLHVSSVVGASHSVNSIPLGGMTSQEGGISGRAA